MELDKTKERPASGSSSDTEAEEEPLAGGGGAGSGVEPPGWRRRWTMLLLCFSGFVLCNLDRVNMAIAILPLSKDAGWDSATIGLVQSSFFWGYLATQMVGGVWADKHGAKRVLGLGVAWWSVSTVLTPLAARTSLPMLLAVRACMGLGEGVAFPATNSLLSKWVPPKERARSLALVHSGLYAGSMVGLAIAPHMIAHMGWPSVFYIFGSLGMGWYTWWEQQAASAPREDAHISRAELKFIRRSMALGSQQSIAGKATSLPWKVLLSKPPVLALILCHFCHSWGIFILATWMPTYYHEVLGLNLKESGLLSCLPYLTQAVTSNLAGWLADWLIDRGASVTLVRKGMQTVGFLGPAFFLTQLGGVREPRRAVSYLMAAQGLNAFVKAGLYCNHADIGPRYAGFLLGLSHTAGCLAGLMGTAATGYILQRGSWSDVWNVTVGFYLVGTIIWNAFSTGERVFD